MFKMHEDEQLYGIVFKNLDILLTVAAVLMGLAILVRVITTIHENMGRGMAGYRELIMAIMLRLLFLTFYKSSVYKIAFLIIMIAKVVDPDSMADIFKVIQQVQDSFTKYTEATPAHMIQAHVSNAFLDIQLTVIMALLYAAGIMFDQVQMLNQVILLLIGVIVIPLSLFEPFRRSLLIWFGSFVSVAFWSVLYFVILSLFNSLILVHFEQLLAAGAEPISFEAPQLIMMLAIFVIGLVLAMMLIPKLTNSLFYGDQGAGFSSFLISGGTWALFKMVGRQSMGGLRTVLSQFKQSTGSGLPQSGQQYADADYFGSGNELDWDFMDEAFDADKQES